MSQELRRHLIMQEMLSLIQSLGLIANDPDQPEADQRDARLNAAIVSRMLVSFFQQSVDDARRQFAAAPSDLRTLLVEAAPRFVASLEME